MAIQFAVLLFSLSIHEAAHAWTSDRFGDPTARYQGRVTLNPIPHIDPIGTVLFPLLQFFGNFPLIGWAKPVPTNPAHLRNPRKDQIFISLAGPLSNLAAGAGAFVLLALFQTFLSPARPDSILVPIRMILYYAMVINLVLAIFNILPIPPLDGHWILSGVLPQRAAAGFERIGPYGFIILYALLFMGALRYLYWPVYQIIGLLQKFRTL